MLSSSARVVQSGAWNIRITILSGHLRSRSISIRPHKFRYICHFLFRSASITVHTVKVPWSRPKKESRIMRLLTKEYFLCRQGTWFPRSGYSFITHRWFLKIMHRTLTARCFFYYIKDWRGPWPLSQLVQLVTWKPLCVFNSALST